MAGMTSWLQKGLLDQVLGIASFFFANPVYLSLHTAAPTDTGSHVNEISTSAGYSRQSLAAKMGATDSTTGISNNTASITFGPASSSWGTVSYLGIEDSPGSPTGSMLLWGTSTSSRTINTGQSYLLTAGQLSIQFD
jgi:hypothetical protein